MFYMPLYHICLPSKTLLDFKQHMLLKQWKDKAELSL